MSGLPDGLMDAFWDYERALMADDLEAMDRLFAPGSQTLRGDADGLVVGHDAIAAFRRTRVAPPPRTIVETHVQAVDDDHALVVAVTAPAKGGRGQQTQLWRRGPTGWQVTAAHVAIPAPPLDGRVWRVVGDPLLPGGPGPLSGESVAVKDLYAVAGHRVGAGNPTWLAEAAVETDHADAVARLLAAGAAVRGISRTDELAYSLAGTNAHHGTAPNPAAPGRIPGGSSSGSAAAVALGHASIGLGTDTGGSIRVPASYQGLWGLRTTHDAVPRAGLLPLAPSFDTVGWFARTPDLLARVGDVLLPPAAADPTTGSDLVVVPALLELADPDVREAVRAYADDRGALVEDWPLDDLADWRIAFTQWQAWEAWRAHGDWLRERLDCLGADVRGRFRMAAGISAEVADGARAVGLAARARIRDLVADRVLVLPSASSVAPLLGSDLAAVREATLRLTCLAGLAGLPGLNVPLTTADGLPAGACLVAAAGRDRDLLEIGRRG
ncbi:AtzH-like domain-containing protein [Nocardioides plantarum]|uniref:AtzH-like domain-containing protein n=1 Tax=Nocardioides plantarum TaxID=29299 RepID=A0ABV5K796_9ACTN